MSPKEKENLLKVKRELAAKYEHMAKISHSRPAKAKFLRRADHYRRSIRDLERL